jgi:hypothetical protein
VTAAGDGKSVEAWTAMRCGSAWLGLDGDAVWLVLDGGDGDARRSGLGLRNRHPACPLMRPTSSLRWRVPLRGLDCPARHLEEEESGTLGPSSAPRKGESSPPSLLPVVSCRCSADS